MIKTKVFIALIISFLFVNCSGNFLESMKKEVNSGTYHVTGTQINFAFGVPTDTTEIEFMVEIEYPDGVLAKKDTVHFRGLEGSDAGEKSLSFNYCIHSCYTVARLINSALTFDLVAPNGSYTGTGKLEWGLLSLETTFEYRSVRIDYRLQGLKVSE